MRDDDHLQSSGPPATTQAHEPHEADDETTTPSVRRSIDLSADPREVWDAVADPERRQAWLDDDDAASRTVRIDRVDEGRSLTWTWWRPDDEASVAQVHVELTELTDGSTRVAVTERLLAPSTMQARASLATTTRLWDDRVLGLELLVVAAGALVG